MQVFEHCSVVLEVKGLPIKEKKKLRRAVTDNGGSIAYVINKQCTHVIVDNLSNVSSNRLRSALKFQVPVESPALLYEKTAKKKSKEPGQTPVEQIPRDQPKPRTPAAQQEVEDRERDWKKNGKARKETYPDRELSENERNLPVDPSNFEVAKYSIFHKDSIGALMWSVLELQSCKGQEGPQYRVIRYLRKGQAKVTHEGPFCYPSSEKALEAYEGLEKDLEEQDFERRTVLPPKPQEFGSSQLHQLLLEERMNSSSISQEVGVFVELLWTEALGCLGNILKIPITNISLNDVSRAEGLLLQVHKALKEGGDDNQLKELLTEFYTLLPHKKKFTPTARVISHKMDLCQLIRDMLKVSEATRWNPTASCLGKYRALRCSIETVPSDSPEFLSVRKLLKGRPVQVQQLFRVSRPVELQTFRGNLGNVRSLLHSSAPSNFVGILSRGLLLPRVGVEHHGIDRTDIGNLGGGIYFSESLSTSLKYSKPGATDGSRLLLVCEVALGNCKDLYRKDPSLSSAPEGFHSVHGVRLSPTVTSEFEDDEYVVYQMDQVQMKYVVQFSLKEEKIKKFQPTVDLSSDVTQQALPSDLLAEGEEGSIGRYKDRLEEVTAGLLDKQGQPLPLQAVHVRCKLMDLLTQVIIFQSYTNQSMAPIEAKYVFPLDESAAVCGFEAFINGKHIVGQVKEKETARKEYKQAIEKGHGAYLMDQDAPDVFTISVGNLPPGATVLIKITYITELVVVGGSLLFSLPGSVAPWEQSKSLYQRTQESVQKVYVNELQEDKVFTLDMCIQMPYEILDLTCVTHRIKIKKTDCVAVVSTHPGQMLGSEGFQLSFTLSQVHMPRMWVENHPEKDSQACMLVFYPDFESSARVAPGKEGGDTEVIILLDTSESMRGVALQDARRIAVQVLNTLDPAVRVNILSFGSVHEELYMFSKSCGEVITPAIKFAMSSPPVGGSTELWRPLRSLSLLPPSTGTRNLLLISDGHFQNEALTLKLVRQSVQHTRVFTCGVSSTANRHMLRALAQAGGGAYEFFDSKTKHTWMEKVSSQVRRMSCPGCSSVSVKWQQFNPGLGPPLQAPAQLNALFSDCHTLVYGFVPHCTQATLYGKLSNQEIETVVSTSELQKTKGTFLHKLTARALIRDYEDGSLHVDEAEHEGKKGELRSFIIEMSKEYSIVTQYTSFVAIEERDPEKPDTGFTDIPKLIAQEDVDCLSYMDWEEEGPEKPDTGFTGIQLCAQEDAEFLSFMGWEEEVHAVNLDIGEEMYEQLSASLPDEDDEDMGFGLFSPEEDELVGPELFDRTVGIKRKELMEAEYTTEALGLKQSAGRKERARGGFSFSAPVSLRSQGSLPFMPVLANTASSEKRHRFAGRSTVWPTPALAPAVPADTLPTSPMETSPGVTERFSALSHAIQNQRPKGLTMDAPALPLSDFSRPRLEALDDESLPVSAQFSGLLGMLESEDYISSKRSRRIVTDSSSSSESRSEFGSQEEAVLEEEIQSGSYRLSSEAAQFSHPSFEAVPSLKSKFECVAPSLTSAVSSRDRSHVLSSTELFGLQHQDGYWECSEKLDSILNLDLDFFANVFLKEKGIASLGERARANILKLVATLLVLQLLRIMGLPEGKLLKTLFRLKDGSAPLSERGQAVKRAVEWVLRADRQYPCVCTRLEFGRDWESATRQLLGADLLPPHSPLRPVLERTAGI
ncbi:hypothetical protein GJAV_G00213140 [Gymnothorax javanicus]|nr:hypothetical protein GJAV_G00213140 [Gymnothorax javanicus]